MKQLKRLKNMLGGGNDTEEQKGTEEQQSETEMKEGTETTKEEKLETAEKTEPETKAEKPGKKETAKKGKQKTKKSAKKKSEQKEKTKDSEKKPEVEEKPKTKRSDSMTLLEGREEETLTRDNIDENFKQEVMDAGAESLALCFQCGTCTGACPSGRRTPYRIRQIVRKSVMGLKEEVISDDTLWMCTTCYECQERCPRAIKIVDIVKIARNYASQAGYMAKAHKMTGSFVIKTGHGVPINDATMELRKRVGLGELPPTTHQFPEALEEVQAIFKKTGFDNLIGYNWETGTID
jgi:heterodisulfide reductase subunit C